MLIVLSSEFNSFHIRGFSPKIWTMKFGACRPQKNWCNLLWWCWISSYLYLILSFPFHAWGSTLHVHLIARNIESVWLFVGLFHRLWENQSIDSEIKSKGYPTFCKHHRESWLVDITWLLDTDLWLAAVIIVYSALYDGKMAHTWQSNAR